MFDFIKCLKLYIVFGVNVKMRINQFELSISDWRPDTILNYTYTSEAQIRPKTVGMDYFSELKPGFRISQFIGDLLSEEENDFRNTKNFIHRHC